MKLSRENRREVFFFLSGLRSPPDGIETMNGDADLRR